MEITVPNNGERQNAVYKTAGRALELTFIPPKNKIYEKAPVYFMITGGGWHGGSKESMLGFSARSADILGSEGWAVVSPDYRLIGQDENVHIREIVCDCMDAARWVAKYSDILGVDRNRFLVSGHSAGGQLCLMLAFAPHFAFADDTAFDPIKDDFNVIAAAPLSAPTVCLEPDGEKYVGFDYTEMTGGDRHDSQLVSPYYYINPVSPPVMFAYGTHDNLVFPSNSRVCIARLRDFGVRVLDVASERGGHCFEPMVEGQTSEPDFNAVQDALIGFARTVV